MKKISLLIAACFLLSSCSRLDIAFRWIDVYVASKVDDYFDLSSKQKKELKKSINRDLAVVQAQMLPHWIENLKSMQNDVEHGDFEEKNVARYFNKFMTDVDSMKSYFVDSAVHVAGNLEDSQLVYFKKAFKKKTEEDLAKAQNLVKVRSDYRTKYQDFFEMFLGSLTKEQEGMLDRHLEVSCFPAALKVQNNEYIFENFLRAGKTKEARATFVRELYQHPLEHDMPAFREAMVTYQGELQSLISDVLGRMTEKQKASLKKNLADKRAQLEKVRATVL